MKRFAVMGRPIAHSLSPQIHQAFARQMGVSLQYEKIQPALADFEMAVKDFFSSGGEGLNVTSPFKERAWQMADVASPRAQAAQAANTLYIKDGLLHAENTDGSGFITDIERDYPLHEKRGLMIGAGGAARGLIQPLFEQGIHSLTLSNRSMARAEALKKNFPELLLCAVDDLEPQYDFIVHASAAGLNQNRLNLPEKLFSNQPYCYDLTYQLNADSAFVQLAKAMGCKAKDGLGMLIEQAALAFEIWHGLRPETKNIGACLHSIFSL